jgi:16S rRNA processing protein RimM
MIDTNNYFEVGKIYREHGVKGFCKLYVFDGNDRNLQSDLTYILLDDSGREQEVKIEEVTPLGKYFLVRFNIFSKPEEIAPWRKARLWLAKESLDREEGEIYDFEWQGYQIVDQNEKNIGEVKEVQHNPLMQFLVIRPGEDEALVPYVEEWVVEQDDEKKVLKMELPEGLI